MEDKLKEDHEDKLEVNLKDNLEEVLGEKLDKDLRDNDKDDLGNNLELERCVAQSGKNKQQSIGS